MKLTDPYGDESRDRSSRSLRLETLLSAWRTPPFWLARDGVGRPTAVTTADLSDEDWTSWATMIRAAEILPPRTHIAGLRAHARLKGFDVEALEKDGVVRIAGDRAAVRRVRGPQPIAVELGGHSWSLLVHPSVVALDAADCERILQKRFREVVVFEDAILAYESTRGRPDTTMLLLADVLAAPTTDSLSRAWRASMALRVDWAFLDLLPDHLRPLLASALGLELENARAVVDVATDLRLDLFADQLDDVAPADALPEMYLPPSRLTSLLQASRLLSHVHQSIDSHYFGEVAAAFAAIAAPFPLGRLLQDLPPGRALLAALETVYRERPELIATYVSHPSHAAEGAFALLQLPQQVRIPPMRTLELKDEWLEVQRLGREQLLLADSPTDFATIVALGVHDEGKGISLRHFPVVPAFRDQANYEDSGVWHECLADVERAMGVLDTLEGYLRSRALRRDASYLYALRIVSDLHGSGRREPAVRLAEAIVDGYAIGLELDSATKSIPDVLPGYGEALEVLSLVLRDSASWSKWLRPFDAAAYLEKAKSDESPLVDSGLSIHGSTCPESCWLTRRSWWGSPRPRSTRRRSLTSCSSSSVAISIRDFS